MDLDSRRLGALSGLAATFGFIVLYILAILVNPNYRIGVNYLSDLGVAMFAGHPQNPWPFNLACIATGGLAVPFALFALRPALPPGRLRDAGVLVFVIACFFLILVGIFTEDYKRVHTVIAAVFFLGMVVADLLLLRPMLQTPALGKPAAILSLAYVALAFASILSTSISGSLSGTPALETAAVLTIIVWGAFMALRLLFLPAKKEPAAPASTS